MLCGLLKCIRKWQLFLIFAIFLPNIAFADDKISDGIKNLSSADELVKKGEFGEAIQIYSKLLKSNVKEFHIEALFQLGNIALNIGDVDTAIDYYETILNIDPQIVRVRLELARAHLIKENWMKANYHFRLAASDKNIPPEVKENIDAALYYIRKNKNWHVWFNVGAAPDDNINNATEGEQCIDYYGMILCNKLADKEKAFGFNVALGGSHEYKISDNWRLKNEIVVWSSTYDKKEYDDLYLGYTIGPKYVWNRGEIFSGFSSYRRWINHQPYSYALGLKININYDVSKHLSAGLGLSYIPTKYDDYGNILNGDVKGINTRLFYAFDVSKYFILKAEYDDEQTKEKAYSNIKTNYALGFGIELPYGFSIYLEPSISYIRYKEPRFFVRNLSFEEIKEKDITKRYSFSISNRKISLWGFTPTLSYVYTDKNSNIWQREFEKSAFELSINQRF